MLVLTAGEGTDLITDFEVGIDFIVLAGGLSFNRLTFSSSAIEAGGEVPATPSEIVATALSTNSFVMV